MAALWCAAAGAQAQMAGGGPSIYACVDSKGRRLTSDRPIAECLDREQRELNPSGSLRRMVVPPPTEMERLAQEARERAEAERRAQAAEQARRERVMLARYPNEAAHNAERASALQRVDESMALTRLRIGQLERQQKGVESAMARFDTDSARMPAGLFQEKADVLKAIGTQKRGLAELEQEKQRVNQRFDAESARLRPLWASPPPEPAQPAPILLPR
ncbi:DUF4124 domain-containing protein [Xylophilus ampelinus]|nr:DUF4124 domain-containing protein [Xylophilus ampelinus]MCS4510735.1 DUF4124 domain-containing protein [Xylophilus ampelinus]